MRRLAALDTDFLVTCARFKLDLTRELERALDEPLEPVVSAGVVKELEALAQRGSADAPLARYALMIIGPLRVLESAEPVDDWIVRMAKEGAVACTQDTGLKGRLKGRRVLTVRGKGKIEAV